MRQSLTWAGLFQIKGSHWAPSFHLLLYFLPSSLLLPKARIWQNESWLQLTDSSVEAILPGASRDGGLDSLEPLPASYSGDLRPGSSKVPSA